MYQSPSSCPPAVLSLRRGQCWWRHFLKGLVYQSRWSPEALWEMVSFKNFHISGIWAISTCSSLKTRVLKTQPHHLPNSPADTSPGRISSPPPHCMERMLHSPGCPLKQASYSLRGYCCASTALHYSDDLTRRLKCRRKPHWMFNIV